MFRNEYGSLKRVKAGHRRIIQEIQNQPEPIASKCTSRMLMKILLKVFLCISLCGVIFLIFIYFFGLSLNNTPESEILALNNPLLPFAEASFTEQLSTADNPSDIVGITIQNEEIDSSISYCDAIYRSVCSSSIPSSIDVLHIRNGLEGAVYNKAIEIVKNYDWKSSKPVGPNGMLDHIYKFEVNKYMGNPPMHTGVNFYTIYSSNPPKGSLLPRSVAPDHILRPLFTFRNLESKEPDRNWHLAESIEFMFTRDSYSPADISAILKGIITGVNLAHKAGYLINDFDELSMFVKTSNKSEELKSIKGALIFDNGNFIKSESLSDDLRTNYLLNFKAFLISTISRLSSATSPEMSTKPFGVEKINGHYIIHGRMTNKMADFCLVMTNLVENKVTSISELLEHPFITGEPMKETDRCGKRPMSGILRSIENS